MIGSFAAPSLYNRRSRTRSTWQRSKYRNKLASAVRWRWPVVLAWKALSVTILHALGTSDVTLLELTPAHGTIANHGTWMRPTAIRYVLDAQRKLLEENAPQGKQVLSPEIAFVATQMLRGLSSGAPAPPPRPWGDPRRRKRADQRLLQCMVRGLHPKARHGGMGRL